MLPKFNRCFATPGSVLNVKALVGAFNQEKALVGAFSVIVQPVVEPMDRFTALVETVQCETGYIADTSWAA